MQILHTEIPGVHILKPVKHDDKRGLFCEIYNKLTLIDIGITTNFVQDNLSLSLHQGTVRGMHFQAPPHEQVKLISVVHGRILDVVVDIRHGSETFGKHVAVEISASELNQLYVPAGFAHGFCTLEPDTVVLYKVSEYYSPAHDMGILWNDTDLGIDWPVETETVTLSDKDRQWPRLRDLPEIFHYE